MIMEYEETNIGMCLKMDMNEDWWHLAIYTAECKLNLFHQLGIYTL